MTIEDQVRQYVAESFLFSDDGFPFSDTTSLLEEDIIDSTGVLELVMFLEESFGLEVGDDEIVPENFDSVAGLAAYIRRKTA